MKRRQKPYLGPLLAKLAPKIGASVLIEPEWGIAGQITFKNGRHRYFRYNTLDINTMGASETAKDKDYANFFLKKLKYPIVPGKAFFSSEWCVTINSRLDIDAAYRYASTLGFPVVVKPNSGSQGSQVSIVSTKRDFYQSIRSVFKKDRVALVQKVVSGRDYRIVVLDGKIISAYERIPLNVVGDGRTTIQGLLKKKQKMFKESGRDTRIKQDDPYIVRTLKRNGLTLSSKPQKGERVFLRDNANLSTGGDSVDVTHDIHPEFASIAAAITRDMGLRLCGVDLMIDGTIADVPKTYWVLEINSAPGLDHYVTSGEAQAKIVEDLYMEVLKSMEHA